MASMDVYLYKHYADGSGPYIAADIEAPSLEDTHNGTTKLSFRAHGPIEGFYFASNDFYVVEPDPYSYPEYEYDEDEDEVDP